ncbi:MAG: hypothetical protein A2086_02545 [Spirochaetes bacterium GWD1_27_9]|nr:MAG: hypothetical protein A2Z98_04870 [Spirochaetes bacterium GWB1_27_13]OHD23058.1 MAG: hypothetical protein A2Y34_17915 [Spirochaetes bacterium GWC1_27_15]OHD31622.1 MAG: hypothetical protein A2086_02545 [Spirochaetes bacterium GWD1_27_9]
MNIQEFKKVLLNIIKWNEEKISSENNYDLLNKQLLDVYQFVFKITYIFDEKDYNNYDRKINKKSWNNIQNNFPEFQQYNVTKDVSVNISNTELLIGDPIDDLNDIINDFKEVIWCLENTSENDALWYFMFGYESHWGKHLSDLLYYLYNSKFGL